MTTQVVHIGYLRDPIEGAYEGICLAAASEVLYDDPRYLVVHTDTETIHIPHGRVIAIIEPKETP